MYKSEKAEGKRDMSQIWLEIKARMEECHETRPSWQVDDRSCRACGS